MSDSFRRRMGRAARQEAARKAKAAARAMGCTCDAEVVFGAPDHPSAGLGDLAVSVRHDDWCPLLRVMEEREPGLARTQLVMYRPEGVG